MSALGNLFGTHCVAVQVFFTFGFYLFTLQIIAEFAKCIMRIMGQGRSGT